jgi:DNA polymerase-3 subunit chi
MAEVWFYHLEKKTLAQELPGLLMRGLERDLRMAVIAPDDEKLKALSNAIWSYEETSFIPHGGADEPNAAQQKICLWTDETAPNAATFVFYVEGAMPQNIQNFERASILFNGNDEAAVQSARETWKRLKGEGATIRYWKQDDEGRWKDQAA